jgi:hypothetical protein
MMWDGISPDHLPTCRRRDDELTAEERRIIGWLKRQVAEAEQFQELMARRKEWGEAHHHKVKALAWGLAIDAIRRRERAP